MKTFNYLALATTALFTFASCSNDDSTTPVNEEEVITTITTTLTGGGQVITLTSKDLDGDGPNAPVVTVSGSLTAGTTYNGSVKFSNELASPAEYITIEIQEEGDHHQLFFQAPPAIGTFTYNDLDEDGKPIGLSFKLVAGNAAATGNLVVTLIHHPEKSATGVANGDITNAGGSTDAQVTYPIQIVN